MRTFLLFYTVILLFTVKASAQTTGDYRSVGAVDFSTITNWQRWNGSGWVAATAGQTPTSAGPSNTVTVQSGNNVTASSSVSISCTINISDGVTLTLGSNISWINFTVNSGGSFNMPGGSGNATLILYGNYFNNGSTNFWKSDVIITGDLNSPSTSSLQNQGNVIVGGNIIGDFSLTGGTGSSQIYAVNPNATVTITPASVDNNVTPGTQPSSESAALISLINTVIYGNNSCSYTITDPSANIAVCSGGNTSVSISTSGTSTTPIYQWQVNSGSGWNDLSNGGNYSGVDTVTLSLISTPSTFNGYKYRVKVTSGCVKNGNYVTLTSNALPVAPTSVTPNTGVAICNGASTNLTATSSGNTVNWYASATGGSSLGTSASAANFSVSPSISTTYYAESQSTAGCISTARTATALVTVNPILSASVAIAASPSGSICSGTNVTFTATPTNGGSNPSYQWYVGTTTVGTNSPTYSSNSLANNDMVKVVMTSNASPCLAGSPATSNQVTMTVTPNLPVSVAIAASPSGVISAGTSVTFTATPTNGGPNPSYQWYVGTTTVGTNSPTYSSNSLANNDVVKVVMTSNASPCLSGSPATSNQITMSVNNYKAWNGTAGTDWFNASNWTPNGVPTSTTDVIIGSTTAKTLIASGLSATANTITILSGGELDLDTASTLTVKDKIDVNSGGTLNLLSGASLIQTNNTANSGTINVYRDSSKIILNDYTYWSSPTYGTQTLLNFSPNTNPKYFLAYSNGWIYLNASTTTFNPGTGYAILAPTDASTSVAASKNFQFTGTPNNGNISVHVDLNPNIFSSTLIGNPYPSAIDADKFITANTYDATTNPTGTISGTLYFWTHNSTYNGSYTANDYVSYNKSGQVVTTTSASGHANNLAPTQYIASCQGFVVQNVKSGNVVFTNAMRTSGSGAPTVNGNFYKNADASNTVLEKNRIWLNFTNNGGLNFSQILLGYIETATNGYDAGFDGAYYSSGKTGMYSLIGNSRYAIQAKGLPFTNADIIPLGYTTNVKGDATISIDHVDGLFTDGQDIYLEDKLLNVVQNLRVSPYTFSSEAGTFNSRFVLKYICNYLGVSDIERASDSLIISSANQQIKIHSDGESIDKVFVYDMLGKEIFQSIKINANDTLISDPKTQQVLIVKVVLANGRSVNRKIVY